MARTDKEMYPEHEELVNLIPDASKMPLVKGGMVETDTCNPAQKSNRLTKERIIKTAKSLGIPKKQFKM